MRRPVAEDAVDDPSWPEHLDQLPNERPTNRVRTISGILALTKPDSHCVPVAGMVLGLSSGPVGVGGAAWKCAAEEDLSMQEGRTSSRRSD